MAIIADGGGGSTTNVVTYDSLTNTANSLEAAKEIIKTNLKTAKEEFEATASAFKSQQSNSLRNKFEELAAEFDSFEKAVDNQANFLKQTAVSYRKIDSTNA